MDLENEIGYSYNGLRNGRVFSRIQNIGMNSKMISAFTEMM